VARWAIKGSTMPKSVWSLGGRFSYNDQGQTPNMQLSVYDYGETLLLFETRGLVGKHGMKPKVANEYYTSEGLLSDGKFKPYAGKKAFDVEVEPIKVTPGGTFGSFINCVRSRKVEEVNGEIEQAHYSAALCHLGNISYRLGKPVPFNKKTNSLGDNKQVVESFNTVKENLKAVGMNLAETTYQMGPVLNFDAKTEKFIGNAEADKLLTREYRKPFVVPENV
jgi:hypothetical protein